MQPPLSTSYFDNLALLINQADLDEEGRERAANFAGMLSANNSILHFVSELGISLPQILRWLRSPFLHLDVGGIKQLQALQLDLHTQAAALDAIHCLREICNSDAPALQRRLAATKILALNEPPKQPATRATKLTPSTNSSPNPTSTPAPSPASREQIQPTPAEAAPQPTNTHTHTHQHSKTPSPAAENPQVQAAIEAAETVEPAANEPAAPAVVAAKAIDIPPEAAQPDSIESAHASFAPPEPAEISIAQSPPIAEAIKITSVPNPAPSDSIANELNPDSQTAQVSDHLSPPPETASNDSPISQDPTLTNSAPSASDEHAQTDPQDRRPEPEIPRENPGLPLPPRIYSYRRGYPVRN